ncbi:MAG: lamin tail domain-containing protein [Pyrinomonadaceae bacterium]
MNQVWLAIRVVRSLALAVAIVCVGMASTVLAQNADLSVSKSGPATIPADTDAEYTVTVSNFSGQTSTSTNTLTDTFPAELTFVSAVIPDGWTCTTPPVAGPNSITCTSTDAIQDGSSPSFSFIFHVAPGLSNGTQVTNSASISHEGSDPNSMNDGTSFTSTVGTPPPAPLTAGEVLISEFRLSGPGGSEDDYIELYCNRDTDCDISGMSLRGYDPVNAGDFSMTFPSETVIPARQYFLVADSRGYSLSSYGAPNIDVALSQPPTSDPPSPPFYFHDNEGLQLIGASEPTVIDSVGFTGGGNEIQYVEGAGLQRASSRPADQYAYVRKRTIATNGLPQDTNDNGNDFVLVSVTGDFHPGITNPPVLGAPGPQGLSSAISFTNAQLTGALTDPTKPKEEDPNRVRVGEGNSGTLSLRRSFTNNSPFDDFSYISFRVIETSTLNSPNTLGDPQADLRLITSSGTSAEVPSRGGTIPIFGTVLEYDDLCGCPEPQQPNGGGLNSTVYVDPGEREGFPSTFDAQFLFNVNKAGFYRFYVYAEAIPYSISDRSTAELTSSPGRTSASRVRSKTTTPRKFASAKRPQLAATKQTQRTPVLTPMTGARATPVTSPATLPPTRLVTPRVIIINRYKAEGEKKPRKKTRVRRKNSAALKQKAEEKFAVAAEKPQN